MNLNKIFTKKNKEIKTSVITKKVDINPKNDWIKILIAMFSILVLSIILVFILFYLLAKGLFISKSSKAEVESFKIVQLQENELKLLVDMFKARKETRENIIKPKNILDEEISPEEIVQVEISTN